MTQKCRAKGGVEACTSPQCPEKKARFERELDTAIRSGNLAQFAAQIKKVDWLDPDTVLLKTVHGSKLYGTNHAASDDDFWIVRPTKRNGKKRNITHTITENIDATELDFASFVKLAEDGVPQALEAMFSGRVIESQIEHFRQAFHATGSPVWNRYRRTIKSFAMEPDLKHRRHALRLAYNLRQLMEQERFNPTLTPAKVEEFTTLAQQDDTTYRQALEAISPLEIGFPAADHTQSDDTPDQHEHPVTRR